MKKVMLLLVAAMLATFVSPAGATTITFTAPSTVSGPFDVLVQAQNLFAGGPNVLTAFGFNVSVSDPSILSYVGATSGPLFDTASSAPGTDVFAAASGFGIEPGAPEPLLLATLHFNVIGTGAANIFITSDLSNVFQGLQFIDAPFAESIAGTVPVTAAAATAVPEPATLLLSGIGLLGLSTLRHFKR
jgi:hypothetical protein